MWGWSYHPHNLQFWDICWRAWEGGRTPPCVVVHLVSHDEGQTSRCGIPCTYFLWGSLRTSSYCGGDIKYRMLSKDQALLCHWVYLWCSGWSDDLILILILPHMLSNLATPLQLWNYVGELWYLPVLRSRISSSSMVKWDCWKSSANFSPLLLGGCEVIEVQRLPTTRVYYEADATTSISSSIFPDDREFTRRG